MSDVLAGLGARSAPIERAPENLSAAQRQGWERTTINSVKKDDETVLVIALPRGVGSLQGADLAEYVRTNPLIVMAWSNPTTGFSQLTDRDREAALRALEHGTTSTFSQEALVLQNEAKIAEFATNLDSALSQFGFNPSKALYELYRNGVFAYVDSQQDDQLKEGYRQELMQRMAGLFGEGFDFQAALGEEAEFRGFLQGFLSLLSSGTYYDACLYGLPQFSRQETGSRLSDLISEAIEEYAGIPQELLREMQTAGRLSRPLTENEFTELLSDGRVQRPVDQDWTLPLGQSDVSESARALRLFMTELGTLSGISDQEKGMKYAYLYNLWTIAQGSDILQNTDAYTMAAEFYRVTGLEISSEAVRSAWEENRYAMR